MFDWVVRGGIANPQDLQAAYRLDPNVPSVFGFSVQYQGAIDWNVLAVAGNFPHSKICYADRTALESAVALLGYTMLLIATPGRGYHHELSLTLMKDGQMLTSLPDDAAQALSYQFSQHITDRP